MTGMTPIACRLPARGLIAALRGVDTRRPTTEPRQREPGRNCRRMGAMELANKFSRKSDHDAKHLRAGLYTVIRAALTLDDRPESADRLRQAQELFRRDLASCDTLPLERVVTDVIVPELLVGQADPTFPAVVDATYSVLQSVADSAAVDLRKHTPAAILDVIDAGGEKPGQAPAAAD